MSFGGQSRLEVDASARLDFPSTNRELRESPRLRVVRYLLRSLYEQSSDLVGLGGWYSSGDADRFSSRFGLARYSGVAGALDRSASCLLRRRGL